MNKTIVIDQYKDEILGFGMTQSSIPDCSAKSLATKENLLRFIAEVQEGESVITKTGFKFLKEYYGLDQLVSIIQQEWDDFPFDDVKTSPEQWLKNLEHQGLFDINEAKKKFPQFSNSLSRLWLADKMGVVD